MMETTTSTPPTPTPTPTTPPITNRKSPTMKGPISPMRVVEYSENSVAIYGNQSALYKEKIKARPLFGRYNPRLKEGAGWIFSKKRETDVRQFVKDVMDGKVAPDS